MDIFNEEFMIATENRFKRFIIISITGMKKDYYRKEIMRAKREPLFYSPELYFEDLMHNCDETFEANILEIGEEDLFLALKSLTAKQLQIIQLIGLEDLTEAEVARLLNISQQGVNKAKASVKKKFMKFRQGGE